MVWLIESDGSIMMLMPKIFGHAHVGTATGGILVLSFYFVLLPFSYLINSSDVKAAIVEESWFRAITGIFNKPNIQVLPK